MVSIARNPRHTTHAVKVRNITLGGGAPVVVQSMTNTDTADVDKTFEQVKSLFLAGSEIVRITVNNDEAAKGTIALRERLRGLWPEPGARKTIVWPVILRCGRIE